MLKPIAKPSQTIALYIGLFLLALLVTVQLARSIVIVSMDMEASAAGTMTINWRDNAGQYSEFKSKKVRVNAGRQNYFCVFLGLAAVDEIRVNPINAPANIAVNNIVIRRLGDEQAIFDTDKHFQQFKLGPALADYHITPKQLRLHTLGNQGAFEFAVQHPHINTQNTALIHFINLKVGLIGIAFLITLGFIFPLLHLPVLLVSIMSALVYLGPFPANFAAINISLHSAQNDRLAVYWAAGHEPYSERQVRRINTQAGSHAYKLGLGQLKNIQHIRIDPPATAGKVLIDQIEISAFGYDPIILNARNQFKGVDLSKNHTLKIVGDTLEFTVDGADTFFEFTLEAENFKINHTLALYYCLLALLGFMALLFYAVRLKYPKYFKTVTVININVGFIILSIMFMQYYWSAAHDFYMDFLNIKVLLLLIALGLVIGLFYPSAQLTVLYAVVLAAVFYHTQLKTQYSTIGLDLQSPVNSEVVVYWANKFEAFQENKMAHLNTQAGRHPYGLNLGRLNDIDSIRIDPLATAGQAVIKTITLSGVGYDPIRLNAANHFYAVDLKANPHLKVVRDGLAFDAKNADDFFEIQPNAQAFKASIVLECYLYFLALLALVNLGANELKSSRPEAAHAITRVSLKVGGIIMLIMLLQWVFSADYSFFVDYQANELVIAPSGEQSLNVQGHNPNPLAAQPPIHLGIINLAYGMVVLSALVGMVVFLPWVNVLYFAAFLLLGGAIGYAIKDKSTLIHIEMDTRVANRLKVYWADDGELYQEQHSASVDTQAGKRVYTLAMANLNNIHNIRIEPLNVKGSVAITQISINELGFEPITLNAGNYFYAADRVLKTKKTNKKTAEQLKVVQDQLVFTTTGNDRFFELTIDPDAFKAPYPWHFYLKFIGLFAGVSGVLYLANRRLGFFRHNAAGMIARVCLTLMAVMILQMAWLSEYGAHPDEKAHIDCIDYYTQYWTPPVVADLRALSAYQPPWGVSRLDDLGVSYWLMGKLKNIITLFAEDTVFTCRVFNSVLIAWLLWGARRRLFALYLMPLLCLPQVWYLFSYANRDGFALFLAVLVGWQLVSKKSHLNNYLNNQSGPKAWRNLLWPALLLGLLSIEVTNYIIFILYFVAVLFWRGLFLGPQRKTFAVRCLILILMAGSIYGARKTADVYLNGFDKQAQRIAYAEVIAAPDFKPSVAATDQGFFGLRLQQKGVAALALFAPRWEWQVLTFKSFAGLYGNEFAEHSPEWYYSYVAYLYGLVALVLLFAAIIHGNLKAWVLTAITAIFVMGDLLMGFLYSWTYDFQPQGRYIFPLIPILMVYMVKMAPLWGNMIKTLLIASAVLLFLLGMFSFRFIALTYLVS